MDVLTAGGIISWRSEFRLKHVASGKYLATYESEENGITTTMPFLTAKVHLNSLNFKFHPLDNREGGIEYKSYCRLQCVSTGKWIHVGAELELDNHTEYVSKLSLYKNVIIFLINDSSSFWRSFITKISFLCY